ncbi:hypothetical protein [Chryseobacterium sp. SIMBA_028]|uniref:hypothetical protein n=1 Tax=Chryseobacterium sp. SIMBA_028 TaxID=3085771 RepID=UPI00397CCBC0
MRIRIKNETINHLLEFEEQGDYEGFKKEVKKALLDENNTQTVVHKSDGHSRLYPASFLKNSYIEFLDNPPIYEIESESN